MRRHLADLVQQDCAFVGKLELSRLLVERTCKCAPLVAEQFRLQQVVRQRCAVHLDERLVMPRRIRMDKSRQHFFADTRFTANQYRNIRIRYLLGNFFDAENLGIGGENITRVHIRIQLAL